MFNPIHPRTAGQRLAVATDLFLSGRRAAPDRKAGGAFTFQPGRVARIVERGAGA